MIPISFRRKSRLRSPLVLVSVVVLSPIGGGCGGKVSNRECVPGRTEVCQCRDGSEALQRCDDDGGFLPCDCSAPITPYAPPAPPPPGPPPGEYLFWGPELLVDAFVGEAGIYVVVQQDARLFDRTGKLLASAHLGRDVTTAAFDGVHLVTFDKALVTVFDAGLQTLASNALVDACYAAVFIDAGRVVCHSDDDAGYDTTFVFDGQSAAQLAVEEPSGWLPEKVPRGRIRRRVPGTGDFVVLDAQGWLDAEEVSLVQADPGNAVAVAGTAKLSPFQPAVTFDADPAEHVILGDGTLLRIHAPHCTVESTNSHDCFAPAGSLGTLSEGEEFIALESVGGKVFGLVDFDPSAGSGRLCTTGCYLEQIDLATRTVEQSTFHDIGASLIVVSGFDPVSRSLVIAYDNAYTGGAYPGHAVTLLPLE